MAGGKETPRQKMIGMMYLVLTALLAMNISKDVLNAFIQINKGLGKTNEILENKAAATIESINQSKEGAKAVPFQQAAAQVNQWTDDMVKYIEEIKARSMACAVKRNESGEGFEEFIVDGKAIYPDYKNAEGDQLVKTPDSQDQTSMLIGSDPANPRQDAFSAAELRKKLSEYRDRLLNLTVTKADSSGKSWALPEDVKAAIAGAFDFPDGEDHDGVKEVWEVNNFYHMPLVAVLANFSKIQTDVMNAKNNVVAALAAGINASDLKFTDVTVAVVPKQSYVLRGGEFEVEIYLAAFNKTSKTKVYMGGEASPTSTPAVFDVSGKSAIESNSDGKCIFKANTGGMSLGEHSYRGQIAYMKDGKEEYIPFIVPPVFVGEPALVVSPVQMNVFYRGLDNPVEISVPGVPQSSVEASCTGCQTFAKGDKGTWNVKPGADTKATISVSATINGEKKSIGTKEFRVKRIPDPVPVFGGKRPTDSTISKGDATVAAGVRADMENFDFNVKVVVKSFKLTIASGSGTLKEYPCTGNQASQGLREALSKAKVGEKIFIEEIMVDMPDGQTRKLAPISLKIV
ncbi:MAG: GldM family protein [Flavobacteriales bacterium]|jgi:gliding motility-associated protein GldM